jgi:predicted membrane metal-binding protein
MSYARTVLTGRLASLVFRALVLALLAWVVWERLFRDPRRPLLFTIGFLLLAASYGLRLSSRQLLPVKIGFAVCMILCLPTLNYFDPLIVSREPLVYEWLLVLAIMPFFPVRPPLGPWWPAAKRTMHMFRGDSREEDEQFKAQILASVKPAGTPQK